MTRKEIVSRIRDIDSTTDEISRSLKNVELEIRLLQSEYRSKPRDARYFERFYSLMKDKRELQKML